MNNLSKVILILMILANWAFAFKLKQLFDVDFAYLNAIWSLVAFLIWGILIMLSLLFVKNFWHQLGAFTLGLSGFLMLGANLFSILAIIFTALAFLQARRNVSKEFNNSIKIRINDPIYNNTWFILVAIFLLVSALFYASPQLENYEFDLTIPPAFFDSIFGAVDNASSGIRIPGMEFMGVNNIINSFKGEAVQQANDYLESLTTPYKTYIPGALVLGLFLSLQILNRPLRWVLAAITSFIVYILTKFGALKKTTVKVDKEVLA